jgi:hypothetical protein
MVSSIGGGAATPKGFLDASRPPAMNDADDIFQRLVLGSGSSSAETLNIVATLAEILQETKGHELDEIWEKIESRLNRSRPLAVKGKTPEAQANTALALFYSALNHLDKTALSTDEIAAFQSHFDDTFVHANNRFLKVMGGVDKRVSLRVAKTTETRLNSVIGRFNKLVDDELVAGRRIPA